MTYMNLWNEGEYDSALTIMDKHNFKRLDSQYVSTKRGAIWYFLGRIKGRSNHYYIKRVEEVELAEHNMVLMWDIRQVPKENYAELVEMFGSKGTEGLSK